MPSATVSTAAPIEDAAEMLNDVARPVSQQGPKKVSAVDFSERRSGSYGVFARKPTNIITLHGAFHDFMSLHFCQ